MDTDFLMIVIRIALRTNPQLKIILMSATLDSAKFGKYFDNCPVIHVPGRVYDVQNIHLAEVLLKTGYRTCSMATYLQKNPISQKLPSGNGN